MATDATLTPAKRASPAEPGRAATAHLDRSAFEQTHDPIDRERLAGAGYRGPSALDAFLHPRIIHLSP